MMGSYDEKAVFSSIDEYGRYAYGNQGKIGQWNMARLADCLLPLLIDFENAKSSDKKSDEEAVKQQALEKVETVIHQYSSKFDQAYYIMYAKKLGMKEVNSVNKALIDDLLTIMQEQSLDYTQTFHYLAKSLTDSAIAEKLKSTLGDWYTRWLAILKDVEITNQEAKDLMTKNNPVVIPRNHQVEILLDRCEQAITDSGKQNTINEQSVITDILDEFLHVLRSPYQELGATKNYQDLPEDNDRYYQTFCGT